MSGIKLPAIERPGGSLYQPRKITPTILGNEDEITGIVIFGTHDKEFAKRQAEESLKGLVDQFYEGVDVVLTNDGKRVWYCRDLAGFDEDRPLYMYRESPADGRPGVCFDAEERESAA